MIKRPVSGNSFFLKNLEEFDCEVEPEPYITDACDKDERDKESQK